MAAILTACNTHTRDTFTFKILVVNNMDPFENISDIYEAIGMEITQRNEHKKTQREEKERELICLGV